MTEKSELSRNAKALLKSTRKEILTKIRELDLHDYLKKLFEKMEPDYVVEITHKSSELGKDLVLVRKDNIVSDVIGVVVKVGDIRGKTLGDVDDVKQRVEKSFSYKELKRTKEIESQVQQAFAHKAEIKSVIDKLPVSKVLIILRGELSQQARERLRRELTGAYDIKDINWLIDKFTEFYPQVFFEPKLIDFIQGKIMELETQKRLFKRDKNLSEYFVEPLISTIDIPVKLDEENLAFIVEKQKIGFYQLKNIITKDNRIILTGDPGVGKSESLAKLSIDMFREASIHVCKGKGKDKPVEIPLLIYAKEVLKYDCTDKLINEYIGDPDIIDRFIIKVVFIDALDEVPSEERKNVLKKVANICSDLRCSLILTSRKIDIIKEPPKGFAKYEVLPFNYNQVLKLFKKVVENKKILDALKDGLEKVRYQIPMIPLALMQLIEIVEDRKEVPASITELYDRYYDLILGRWDKEKGLEILFEYFIKKSFLAKLAFEEFLKKRRFEIPTKDFDNFIKRYATKHRWDEDKLNNFIRKIKRAGILSIKHNVAFRHRTYQDYFGALYIFNNQDKFTDLSSFISEIYFDDTWRNVVFFYFGLKREMSETVLEKIFASKKKGLKASIDKFLVGKLLQAGWHSDVDIIYKGIQKAVDYAPSIREKFLELAEKTGPIPRIYSDFLVLLLSEISFSSCFLIDEAKEVFQYLCSKPTQANLYKMLSILWSIQRLLKQEDIRIMVTNVLDIMSSIKGLEEEKKALVLLFLLEIEGKGQTLKKTIKKKFNRLKKKYPAIFGKLFPHRDKGFR